MVCGAIYKPTLKLGTDLQLKWPTLLAWQRQRWSLKQVRPALGRCGGGDSGADVMWLQPAFQ